MVEALPEDAVFSRPLTVRVREACRLTGIGRSKFYELIAAGEIEIIKVGTITLVPVASLKRFVQRRAGNPTFDPALASAELRPPQQRNKSRRR
ncbi:MAG TPA: helix-turn-helix domain-containing protein [Sphingomicrobium sp.]|nr:helix-turn-helix domain-containing protein [Sphingomicrobium sp.]